MSSDLSSADGGLGANEERAEDGQKNRTQWTESNSERQRGRERRALERKEKERWTRRKTTDVGQWFCSISETSWPSCWPAARESESVGLEEREREEKKGDLGKEVDVVKVASYTYSAFLSSVRLLLLLLSLLFTDGLLLSF
jgi:hypothetical protein